MNTLKKFLDDWNISIPEAAKKTGMSYVSVRRHTLGERNISAESAIAYERAIGIGRHILRPDLFLPMPELSCIDPICQTADQSAPKP